MQKQFQSASFLFGALSLSAFYFSAQFFSLPYACASEGQSVGQKAQTEPVEPIEFSAYKKTVAKIDIKAHSMSLGELEKKLGKSDVYVLDLRSASEYKEGHIKGALHMGCDINEEKLQRLVPKKDSLIVLYCVNNFYPSRRLSLNNACLPQFIALGYQNTFVLEEIWRGDMSLSRQFTQGPLWQKGE